ncbi:hypothetical protein ECANGB1_2774 [Enterospora canceri]|uniref:Uncharacterized protein n=1 Tax=Enterospora canceri TaxID=1081671 RepID=A0A1Y1S9I5_9MICR|nr:hypothetical protein ECANGB1_2774 [Enterospora canceri]
MPNIFKNRFSTLDLVKYAIICSIGTGMIYGPVQYSCISGKNSYTVNIALFIASIFEQLIAQCYAELKCILPQEGGDFLYIEQFFSGSAGTAYALVMLIVYTTGANSFTINLLLDVFKISNNRAIWSLLLSLIIIPITLIPVYARKRVMRLISILQFAAVFLILLSLPLAVGFKKENRLISTTKHVVRAPVTLKTLLLVFAKMHYTFCGIFSCNSLHKDVTGNLYLPYLISASTIYVLYVVVTNSLFHIYRNETGEIDYENVLGFLPGKSNTVACMGICFALYFGGFFANGFTATDNLNYLIKKYKMRKNTNYAAAVASAGIAFSFSFIELNRVMAVLSMLLILSTTLSITGIIIHSRRNPTYRIKVPKFLIYSAIAGCIVTLVANGFALVS